MNPTNVVQIDITTRNPAMPGRRQRPTLNDYVLVERAGKKQYKYFFDPKTGAKVAPQLPITLRKDEPYYENNRAFIELYKAIYGASEIQIIDQGEQLTSEADKLALETKALTYLAELKASGSVDKMIQLIRQLEGPVPAGTTQTELEVKLGRIAKDTPQRLLDASEDTDFGVKAVILSAIDGGRIVQKDRFYYERDGKTLLSDGLDQLISKYRTDKNVKALLDATVIPVKTTTKAKSKEKQIDELLAAGSPATVTPLPSAQETQFSDAKLAKLVDAATEADYYTKEPTGYRIDDGQILSKEAIVGWLKANPAQAQDLENSLLAGQVISSPIAN